MRKENSIYGICKQKEREPNAERNAPSGECPVPGVRPSTAWACSKNVVILTAQYFLPWLLRPSCALARVG